MQPKVSGLIIQQPQAPNKPTIVLQPTVPAATYQQILPQTSNLGLIQPTLAP